jgi:hypothetical protein
MAKDYQIAKTPGACSRCETAFTPEQTVMATVREGGEEGFLREDFCTNCWPAGADGDSPDILASWQTVIPTPAEKKKLLVDDEVLINFFRRLADAVEPAKVTFRYVLGLILMRKRKLIYDGPGRSADGVDIWKMHFRGTDEHHEVIDPGMDEDQILEVSQNLSQIMELDE